FVVPYLYTLSFSFNATAPTEIYTLSLHDALPIWFVSNLAQFVEPVSSERVDRHHGQRDGLDHRVAQHRPVGRVAAGLPWLHDGQDRKSTRLNSSHLGISYAVFCLKKKKKNKNNTV